MGETQGVVRAGTVGCLIVIAAREAYHTAITRKVGGRFDTERSDVNSGSGGGQEIAECIVLGTATVDVVRGKCPIRILGGVREGFGGRRSLHCSCWHSVVVERTRTNIEVEG